MATIADVQPSGHVPAGGWRGFTTRVALATPVGRDRALDGLRALATLGVIAGHWLVGALVLQPDGGLAVASPLRDLGGLAPVSWFLQLLGLFFLVGGRASALSLARSTERGESYAGWLRQRLVRLCRPVVAAVALSAAILFLLGAAGVPTGTLRTWIVLLVQPFWFVAVYAGLTALTAYAVWAGRRWGAWAALPLVLVVAVVDLLRYGPWHDAVPAEVGLVNLLPGWLFTYQLGVCWAQGRLDRRLAWVLLVGGAATFALLVGAFDYPMSMVGVPGAGRTNAHPPSLLVPALAAVQSGAAVLLHARLDRALRRPSLWAAVALVNLSAMTIFCWHQVPMLLVSMAGSVTGDVPGLTTNPADVGWLLARLAWLPVMGLVLVAIVAVMRRFDATWSGLPRWTRPVAGVLAVAFAGMAAVLY